MDKQKQILEIAEVIAKYISSRDFEVKFITNPKSQAFPFSHTAGVAEDLYNAGYRKIPENAVVIPKEISFYENIEKRVRTFRIDGNNVDFTDEQIMALTQILHFKEKQENEIRKETAERFAERLKVEFDEILLSDTPLSKIDEICKEFTEGK